MKLVVDTNCLQTEELRYFLQKSTGNVAVLTDFAAMEAYKGDTLASIYKSMQVVSAFPRQVLVLKGSAKVFRLNGKVRGLQRRLVDETQTRGFPNYVRTLVLGRDGNYAVQKQLLAHGRAAQAHFDKMLLDAETMKPVFDKLAKLYTREERAIIRDGRPYTSEMIGKLGKTLIEISGLIINDSPLVLRTPTYKELSNTFMFRVALSSYLMAIRRGALGGSSEARSDYVRNDLVDMIFVAYGTYFDGVLSNDHNVKRIYEETCLMLSALFDAEVPSLSWIHRQ